MYVWPCAVVCAQYLWFHRRILTGKRVLELGAGVSLPGVTAAKCGADVILSDSAETPQCLENCRRSCAANNIVGVPVIGLTWGQISPDLLDLPPIDIIVGSDVFYEPEDFEDILVTVRFLMERNAKTQFWTSHQVRSPGGHFAATSLVVAADWMRKTAFLWTCENICAVPTGPSKLCSTNGT
ncbi:hypothetical protein FKM82_007877 [Ascaphus truei]